MTKPPAAAAPPPPPPPAIVMEVPTPAPILDPQQLRRITDATRDPDASVRWEAAQFLIRLKQPDTDQVLFRMLAQDPAPDIRVKVIDILTPRKSPEVTQALISALKDTEAEVRNAALRGLGRIGDPSAAPAITELLKDMEERVRLEAVRTLRTLQEASDEAVKQKAEAMQRDLQRRQEEEARKRAQQQQQQQNK